MSLLDFDASIECSRGCVTLDDDHSHLLNTSDTMNCSHAVTPTVAVPAPLPSANGHRPHRVSIVGERLEDIDAPSSPNDSFNYTAFIEGYHLEGDSLLRRAEMSDDDDPVSRPVSADDDPMSRPVSGDNSSVPSVKDPSQIISDVKGAIEKRDGQVSLLVSKLEEMSREKEEQELEVQQLRQKVSKLEAELEAAESAELDTNQFGPAELSSYLHLPATKGRTFDLPRSRSRSSDLGSRSFDLFGPRSHEGQVDTMSREVQATVSLDHQATATCQELAPKTFEFGSQFSVPQKEAASQNAAICAEAASQAEEVKKRFAAASTQNSAICVEVASQAEIKNRSAEASTQNAAICVEVASQAEIKNRSAEAFTQKSAICAEMASQAEEVRKSCAEASTQEAVSLKEASTQASLPDEAMKQKCSILKESAAVLKAELKSLREAAQNLNSSDFEAMSEKMMKSLEAVERTREAELSKLEAEHAQQLANEREEKAELRNDLGHAHLSIKQKEEDILELKIKVAQLEYSNSRKVSEPKMISFSSRMSPEGSELDVDNISLPSDSTNSKVKLVTLPEVKGQLCEERSLAEVKGQLPEVKGQTAEEGKSSLEDEEKSEHYEITRTKMEYLWLTPSVDADHVTGSTTPTTTVVEDLKLQFADLEKKFGANLRYLEEQTAERELERDEFQRECKEFQRKIAEIQRDRDRFQELSEHYKLDLEEFEQRFTEAASRTEAELLQKTDKLENDLKNSIDKIYELRGIIRDLEEHIDLSTANVGELREANEILREELEKLLREKVEEALLRNAGDTLYLTAHGELTQDELLTQVQDLADRLSKKLSDLENYKWSASISRPGSGSSNASGQTSCSEDVSVRDIVQAASGDRNQELTAAELLQGIRRLDVHFENFVKFEEIMMKKLKDTEIRLGHTMKRQAELELEKAACQEQLKEQLLRVSDLESHLDQRRFEPSPNSLTLGDLRSRVKDLTEELQEVKGQVHLKTIELDHLKEKMAANEAMRATQSGSLNFSARPASAPPLKLSMTTQTMGPICRNRSLQTAPPAALIDAGSQTVAFQPDMDLSSISGAPPPLHSTPTDPPQVFKNSKVGGPPSAFFQKLFGATESAPEALRREAHDRSGGVAEDDLRIRRLQNASIQKRRKDSAESDFAVLPPLITSESAPEAHAPNATFEHSAPFGDESEEVGTLLPPRSRTEEMSLLHEIQSLRAQNGALEAQLSRITSPEHSSVQNRAPPPCNNGVTSPTGKSKPSKKEAELTGRLHQLEKEKAELEWRFEAGMAQSETLKRALEEEQKKFRDARIGVERLGAEVERNVKRIRDLEEICAARTFHIERLEIQHSVERQRLEKELERVRCQLDAEVEGRRAVQEGFDVAKRQLTRHLSTDQVLRDENLRLMGELEALREMRFAQAQEIDALAAQRQVQQAPVTQGRNSGEIKRFVGAHGNLENLELYLRAKSYRKALTWQKKYLILVIQGYRDLLDSTGVAVPYHNLLQNEIPLTPTSVGLIDLNSVSTRFRICAKAVLATVRMKFMVRRWEGRGRLCRGAPMAHENHAERRKGSAPVEVGRRGSLTSGPWRSLSVVPGLTLSSLSTAPPLGGSEVETVLSDYLRRIQSLESEVEGVFKKNGAKI